MTCMLHRPERYTTYTTVAAVEVTDTVNEMKSGKAPDLDGFPVECLKKYGMAVLKWLVRLLNMSFDMGVLHTDWRGACTYSTPVQRQE